MMRQFKLSEVSASAALFRQASLLSQQAPPYSKSEMDRRRCWGKGEWSRGWREVICTARVADMAQSPTIRQVLP